MNLYLISYQVKIKFLVQIQRLKKQIQLRNAYSTENKKECFNFHKTFNSYIISKKHCKIRNVMNLNSFKMRDFLV